MEYSVGVREGEREGVREWKRRGGREEGEGEVCEWQIQPQAKEAASHCQKS